MKTFKNNFARTIVAAAAFEVLAQGAAAKGKKAWTRTPKRRDLNGNIF